MMWEGYCSTYGGGGWEMHTEFVLNLKISLGGPRGWWDIIKIDLKETEYEGVNWIQLTKDRVQWLAVVNTIMNLRDP
jgi:hypothetical protein